MLHVSADEIPRNQDCEGGRKEHTRPVEEERFHQAARGGILWVGKNGREGVGDKLTVGKLCAWYLGFGVVFGGCGDGVEGWEWEGWKAKKRRTEADQKTPLGRVSGGRRHGGRLRVKGLSPARLKWTKGRGGQPTTQSRTVVVTTENAWNFWMCWTLCLKTCPAEPEPSGLSAP